MNLPVIPGAEAYFHAGTGGTGVLLCHRFTASPGSLRPWEADRAYEELRGQSNEIFVMGLSMGGCLALRMAELRGAAVSGLVLVNPSLAPDTKLFLLAPVLKLVVPSLPGIASDIKKEGVQELGYTRVPVRAAASLPALWRLTQSRMGEGTQPGLVYRRTVDHVVGPGSMRVP